MAREVQASEAKTHFARLLDEVERGETIVINRHGRAIARIVPEARVRQQEIDRAIEDIKELRKQQVLLRAKKFSLGATPAISINALQRQSSGTAAAVISLISQRPLTRTN